MNKTSSLPSIIDIVGKTPFGDLLLQSAPDKLLLQQQLRQYFEKEMASYSNPFDIKVLQKILNRPANKVAELSMYEFEPSQRIYEVAVTLLITQTVNKLANKSFIPAWQKPGQDQVMKDYMKKGSWDGFIYENPKKSHITINPFPIEIKSLMIDPKDTGVISPDQLLNDRLPGLKKHFQIKNSIYAIFVPPYTAKDQVLSFDLKNASININKAISKEATGCVCLLSFPENNTRTHITMHCYLISKNPTLINDGKIKRVEIGEMTFGVVA